MRIRPGFMHLNRKSEKSSGGFSLIEAIIGMGVVGIMITALYSAFTTGFRTEQLDREDIRATQLLIEKMDQLRVISWEQLTDPSITPTNFDASFNPDETPVLRGRGLLNNPGLGLGATNGVAKGLQKYQSLVYNGTVNITDAPNDTTYSSDMKQVTVTVQWKAQSGMERTRTFTTFVARYGMQNYHY